MNNRKIIFAVAFLCAPSFVCGESLLTATKFPKTFGDIGFTDRYEILAEGYGAFDTEYDADGNCISGCAYAGITLEQDQKNTDEATQYFSELVENSDEEIGEEEIYDEELIDTDVTATAPDVDTQAQDETIIKSAPPIDETKHAQVATLPVGKPVKKNVVPVSSDFGWRTLNGLTRLHNGIDIAVPLGTRVYATGGGTVVVAQTRDNSDAGKYVAVQHSNGLYSQYMHLSKLAVKRGQTVKRGTVIGYVGNTGRSFGPHLHYSVYWKNKSGVRAYVDILCPCKSTNKQNKDSSTTGSTYSCGRNALNGSFQFVSCQTKQNRVNWRIKHKHCMRSKNDLLPGEMRICK